MYGVIETIEKSARLVKVGTQFIGDYSWRAMSVWYSPLERKYFWYSDSGCSCNSFGDDVRSLMDFENGDKLQAMKAVQTFGAQSYRDVPDNVDALWETVRTFRAEDAEAPETDESKLKEGESFDYGITYLKGRGVNAEEQTVWGYDASVIGDAIENNGYVETHDFDYVRVMAIERRVAGPGTTVWTP